MVLNSYSMFYYVKDELLQRFDTIAQQLKDVLTPYIPSTYYAISFDMTVLNIWCAILAKKEQIFLNESKRMDHTAIFMQLQMIETNSVLTDFLSSRKLTDTLTYSLAFFVTMEVVRWVEQVMQERSEQVSDEQQIIFEQQPQLAQKMYMLYLQENIRETTEFNEAILRAVDATRTFSLHYQH